MEELKKAVEEAMKMSEDELKTNLPPLMDQLKGNVGKLMEAVPDLIPKLMNKMNEIDIGKFVSEAPELSSKFMDVLWEGASILAEKNADIQNKLKSAGEIGVNFEATDSPLKGHLKISGGKISGGTDLLPKADLTLRGPTKVLVGMFAGTVDPIKGFMAKQYTMEGSMAIGMKLAPVMTSLTRVIKGS